jgi:hypothetical protein
LPAPTTITSATSLVISTLVCQSLGVDAYQDGDARDKRRGHAGPARLNHTPPPGTKQRM